MVEGVDHLQLLPTLSILYMHKVFSPLNEVNRHMSAPLHCYIAEEWLVFSNSCCLLSGHDLGARVKREQTH
jgi:hypothetical protein